MGTKFRQNTFGLDYEQSLFHLQSVEQNARHANRHVRAAPLSKSEEKERLLAVYLRTG